MSTDPIFPAIDAHRIAAADLKAAERGYEEAVAPLEALAAERFGHRTSRWWHFAPDDLGYFASLGEPKTYSPLWERDLIDAIADAGGMMLGERERLHAALDGNLRHKQAIDRLGVVADEALEREERAMRDLFDTSPTTMAGASALQSYLRS
jgi:hypothetical protein